MVGAPAEAVKQVEEILAACHNNMCQVHLSRQRWEKAAAAASDALKLQPRNSKALFRRARARHAMRHLEEARKDIDAALELDPADTAIRKESELVCTLKLTLLHCVTSLL